MNKKIKFITILCALVMVSSIIVGCHHKAEETEKREAKDPNKIVEAKEPSEEKKLDVVKEPREEKKPDVVKEPREEKKPDVVKKPGKEKKPDVAKKPKPKEEEKPSVVRTDGENIPTSYLILAPPSLAGTGTCVALNTWVEKIDGTMTKVEEEIQRQENEILLLEQKQETFINSTLYRKDNKKILLEHTEKSIQDKKVYTARLVDNMEVLRRQFIHTSNLYVTSCIY